MNKTQKTISLAIGGALALSVAATTVNAAENPFALKTLANGYQVADAHDAKSADGKCGTGKCGTAEKPKKWKCKMQNVAPARPAVQKKQKKAHVAVRKPKRALAAVRKNKHQQIDIVHDES